MNDETNFGEGHNSEAEDVLLERIADSAKVEIDLIEKEQAEIDAINEEAKREKAPHQDSISALKKRIRDEHGMGAKPLGLILAKRKMERRIADREEALQDADKDQYDMFQERHGDAA